MSEHIGRQLGNYRLTQLLGRGGFADTYLGEQIYLKTYAAIKVLQAQLADTDKEAFFNEARTIARLRHPNIVRVLEFSVEGTIPYLVMDYAPNGTLRRRHPRGISLSPDIIVPYVKNIAEALQFAHDQKLIHRDVKPENMLLGPNMEVLLSDFGIAIIAQNTRAQGVQDVAGTMTYMAPEQIQGKPRPASDQYALAVVVYEWLCGVVPFTGTYTEVAIQHERSNPLPLRQRIPNISEDIDQVVLTALSKDPARRFGSVRAFANALEQATMASHPQDAPKKPSGSDAQFFIATEIASYGPQNAPQTAYGFQPPASSYQPIPSSSSQASYSPQGTPLDQPLPFPSAGPQSLSGTTPSSYNPNASYGTVPSDPSPYGTAPANPAPYGVQQTPSAHLSPYGTTPANPTPYGAQQTPASQNPYGAVPSNAPQQTPASQNPYNPLPSSGPNFYGSPTSQSGYGIQPQPTPAGQNPYGLAQPPQMGQNAYNAQQGSVPLLTPSNSQSYGQMSMGGAGAQPPNEKPPRRLPVSTTVLIAIMAFLLIGGSVLIYFTAIYIPGQQHAQATSTAVAQVTGTGIANATSTGVANATATGVVQATASAVASATAYPTNLFTQSSSGKPTLNDALTTPDGNGWQQYAGSAGGGCAFKDGAYHAVTPINYYTPCQATATHYGNMAYEVEVTMLTGHNGGLIFHSDNNDSGYYFRISTDGSYKLERKTVDSAGNATSTPLVSGTTDVIKSGGNPNTIAIVDKSGDIFVYVNGTYLNRFNDTTYSSGYIGVYTDSDTQGAEAAFRNVKVWQL